MHGGQWLANFVIWNVTPFSRSSCLLLRVHSSPSWRVYLESWIRRLQVGLQFQISARCQKKINWLCSKKCAAWSSSENSWKAKTMTYGTYHNIIIPDIIWIWCACLVAAFDKKEKNSWNNIYHIHDVWYQTISQSIIIMHATGLSLVSHVQSTYVVYVYLFLFCLLHCKGLRQNK